MSPKTGFARVLVHAKFAGGVTSWVIRGLASSMCLRAAQITHRAQCSCVLQGRVFHPSPILSHGLQLGHHCMQLSTRGSLHTQAEMLRPLRRDSWFWACPNKSCLLNYWFWACPSMNCLLNSWFWACPSKSCRLDSWFWACPSRRGYYIFAARSH